MKRALFPLLVVATSLAVQSLTPSAFACSCLPASDQEYYDQADVVFVGKVTNVNDPNQGNPQQGDDLTYTFALESTQKGSPGDPADVISVRASNLCGYSFTTNKRYQVYADDSGGSLRTGLCSGNRALDSQSPYYPPTPTPATPTPSPTPPPTDPPDTQPTATAEPVSTGAPTPEPTDELLAAPGSSDSSPLLLIIIIVLAVGLGATITLLIRRTGNSQ